MYTVNPGTLGGKLGAAIGPFRVGLVDQSGNPYAAPAGGQAFTLSDGGAGGTFAPASLTVAAGAYYGTFTYMPPATAETGSVYQIVVTANGGLEAQYSPQPVTVTAVASNYVAWPALADVQAFLVRAGISLRYNVCQPILDGVIREVERRTLRQFICDTVDTTRIYDGSGSAEQEVDEIVSLTGVVVVGYQTAPGYTLANVMVVNELHKPQTRLVCARGSLPALVGEGYIAPYPTQFPMGRQNIQVTGRFGYGPVVPEDLWTAVCAEMAYRLAREAIFQPGGRVAEDFRGDVKKKYTLTEPVVLGWHDDFERCMTDPKRGYRRPSGRRLRNMRGKPIGF